MTKTCMTCGSADLLYPAQTDRGTLNNCLPCLMIRRIGEQTRSPFDWWDDRDEDVTIEEVVD
jgi:hypothetical protein